MTWILSATELVPTEWLMVFIFIGGVIFWGWHMRKAGATMESSFLADRNVPGFIASLSTVATNLNVNDFFGGAGMAYGIGMVMVHGHFLNGIALVIVSLFLVQKLRRLNVFTLGGWLEKRYCTTVGVAYSLSWSLVWMMFNLGLYIFAGALVLNQLVGWDMKVCIIGLSIVAAVYTLLGGFRAVVATDVLQIALMFFPFIFVAASAWIAIGGPAGLAESLSQDYPDKAHLWQFDTPFGPLPLLIVATVMMNVTYWSTEAQVIQRPLSAKSEQDATMSYLGASFWFTVLVPLLILIPALAAIKLFPNLENPDYAMPSLISEFLPPGLYGVTIIGLIAGFFSSADSQINAFCGMFIPDIYKRFIVKNKSENHYVKASKFAGVAFTLLAILTALVFMWNHENEKQGMTIFALSILVTIMPPFGAITILGALWKRIGSKAAIAGLAAGMVTAVTLIVMDLIPIEVTIVENGTAQTETVRLLRHLLGVDITFTYRGFITIVITTSVTVLFSYIFKRTKTLVPQDIRAGYEHKTAKTRWNSDSEEIDISNNFSVKSLIMAGILIVACIGMYLFWSYYFA